MRKLLVITVTAAVALGLAGSAIGRTSSTPKLKGVVGPGFSITLKKGTTKVTSLKAGTYAFVISDKASIHNFVLEREKPGHFEKTLTGVGFTGTKTIKIKLTRGEWKYYCAPHEASMFGHFKVK